MSDAKMPNKKNNLAKIIALFAAVMLWLYVMNEQNPILTASYNVVLNKQKLASDMVLTSTLPEVRVRISATRSVLSNLSTKNIKAYVDLDDVKEGTHTRKVLLQVPPEVQVLEVVPDSVAVSLDKLISRSLPVEINFYKQTLKDFDIESVALVPNAAIVEGAKKDVDKVSKIEAVYKQIDTVEQQRVLVDIVAVDENGILIDNVKLEPKKAYLTIDIKEKVITKTVPIKMTLTGGLPSGFRIISATTNPDKIEIAGSISNIKDVKEIITDNISLNALQADFKGNVKLILPKDIEAKTDTVEVDLKIQK